MKTKSQGNASLLLLAMPVMCFHCALFVASHGLAAVSFTHRAVSQGAFVGNVWALIWNFKTRLDSSLTPGSHRALSHNWWLSHANVHSPHPPPPPSAEQRAVPVMLCTVCGGVTGHLERLAPPRWPSAFDLRPTWRRDIAQRCCGAQHFRAGRRFRRLKKRGRRLLGSLLFV